MMDITLGLLLLFIHFAATRTTPAGTRSFGIRDSHDSATSDGCPNIIFHCQIPGNCQRDLQSSTAERALDKMPADPTTASSKGQDETKPEPTNSGGSKPLELTEAEKSLVYDPRLDPQADTIRGGGEPSNEPAVPGFRGGHARVPRPSPI
ncbi:hypothetical protein DFS34DRAFT_348316 [Phlyctochytrium arcticum]|nr:hypothetical protein DFS34DRAFT_348316 [Phlyctochytrium arcticum]